MSTSSNPSRRTIPMRSRWPGTAGKEYSLHEIRVALILPASLAEYSARDVEHVLLGEPRGALDVGGGQRLDDPAMLLERAGGRLRQRVDGVRALTARIDEPLHEGAQRPVLRVRAERPMEGRVTFRRADRVASLERLGLRAQRTLPASPRRVDRVPLRHRADRVRLEHGADLVDLEDLPSVLVQPGSDERAAALRRASRRHPPAAGAAGLEQPEGLEARERLAKDRA